MNNPFGLSDEIISAVISDVIRRQQQMTKKHEPKNPFNVDSSATSKKSASMAKEFYNAYMEEGFTQEQAFELLKCVLTARKI